ncbi:uncharacterized protein DEA37_0014041, partial [Paragonimus westermani]
GLVTTHYLFYHLILREPSSLILSLLIEYIHVITLINSRFRLLVLMDYVQLLAIPLCLATFISTVTLICLYCVRFKVEPSSGEEKYVHRKKHRNKQISGVTAAACSSTPIHPYLPPSLCTVMSTSCETDQVSVTRAGIDSSASETVALLVRQEGNSHRNCELPPVPSGADYKQDPTELRRYSMCDDPQSESDGLYASVGHHSTANGGVGISRSRNRPHTTTMVDNSGKVEFIRLHFPFLSLSILLCSIRYLGFLINHPRLTIRFAAPFSS